MKDKTKKVLKTIGLVVLSLLATLGVVLGGLLIGEMGKGNTKPVLMEEERTSLRSPVKRKPDFTAEGYNLLEQADIYSCYIVPSAPRFSVEKLSGYSTYYMPLEAGYYYYDRGSNPEGTPCFTYSTDNIAWFLNDVSNGQLNYEVVLLESEIEAWGMAECANYSNFYFYMATDGYFSASSRNTDKVPNLYLVDTAEVPATSRITFGDNWYPLKIFGDNVTSGGSYLIMDEATLEHTYTGGYTTTLAVLFRYQGVVYDRIRFMCTNLNGLGKPYVDESGTIQHPDRPSSNSIFVLESVTFYSSWLTGDDANYLKVLSAQHSDSPSTDRNNNVYYPYLGKTQWLTQSRTIEILDEIDTNVYTSGRWQGYNALQVLQFISSYYSDGSSLAVADGQSALELLTTAFASVAPILGISLFPNITIGLLIFLPLVAGIIVLIIKAVKK